MSCKINFASSISPSAHTRRDFFLQLRKARERELATVDENRRAVGMLNPMRDKIEGTYRGGRDDTCDHGLSRRSLRVKPPTN